MLLDSFEHVTPHPCCRTSSVSLINSHTEGDCESKRGGERASETEREILLIFFFYSLPFLDSHASHLAFPLKSNIPGLSTVVRRRQEMFRAYTEDTH